MRTNPQWKKNIRFPLQIHRYAGKVNKWNACGLSLRKQWLDNIMQALNLIPIHNIAEGTGPKRYSLLLVILWDYGHIASIIPKRKEQECCPPPGDGQIAHTHKH